MIVIVWVASGVVLVMVAAILVVWLEVNSVLYVYVSVPVSPFVCVCVCLLVSIISS